MRFKSLNEAIQSVTNPLPELTQNEYISLLESVLEAIAEELECSVEDLLEDYQTPERADQTDRLRMRTRKAAEAAAKKYEQAKTLAQYEKESPKTYGSKGKVVKASKKMLKTRASSEKAKETKRSNEINKYRSLRATALETDRKNAKTPQGRRIAAASKAEGQRNDLGW